MNRFFAFFFVSFLLHIAVGAILLSRTGFFGGYETEEKVELDDSSEILEEIKKPEFKKSSKKKKSSPLSKKKEKQGKLQPVKSLEKKENPLVEKKELLKNQTEKTQNLSTDKTKEKQAEEKKELKPEPSPPDSVKQKETPAKQTQEVPGKTKEKQAEEKKELKPEPSPPGSVKQKEAPEKQSQEEAPEKQSQEEAPEKQNQEEAPEKQSQEEATEKKQGEAPEKKQKDTPQNNEQSPAALKPSGFYKQSIPALDIGTARIHTQLKQAENNPVPAYPEEALENKWEGRVEVYYYVNPAGFVEKIHLKNSSGHSVLDNSALRTLARYRYYPGQEGWVRHLVEFFLEKDKEIKKTAPLRLQGSPRSASQN